MTNDNELLRLREQLVAKEKELGDQKWIFEQFVRSPAWRATAPARWVVNQLRRLRNGKAPVLKHRPHILPKADSGESREKRDFSALLRIELECFLAAGTTLELPSSADPEVSIVLVLFNRAEMTLACLRSIIEQNEKNIEVVIVDNASSDETAQLLGRIRGARFFLNSENRHFLLGVQQASRECRGKNILLLNNDARLMPGALRKALDTLVGSDDIGAVGGKLILVDGTLQEAGSVVWQDGSCAGYGRGDDPFWPMYNFRRDVDYCSGAFLLTPRKTWEALGGFDEAYKPAYYEETDYCMRLWDRGLRVVYEPDAAIIHYEFASSSSSADAVKLQEERKSLFASRHRKTLQTREPANSGSLLHVRARHHGKRVLFFEDRVPHVWLGSGFPRAQKMIAALHDLGFFVTLYPLAGISESWDGVYSDIPKETEVMLGWGSNSLEFFFRTRMGYYSTIVVSRPHNMATIAPILKEHPDWFSNVAIIYDAEAFFASREVGLRKLSGVPITEAEKTAKYAREINLAAAADLVIAVSESDRAEFVKHGIGRVEVVGHSIDVVDDTMDFHARSGLLFVGAVHVEASPNGDSLIWFLREIFPKVRAALRDVTLTIAGVNHSETVRKLAGKGVTITGHVPSVAPLYAKTRLFVAPTRYAAGIPHKVHEAAAHGLPVVTTPLLAEQLNWTTRELAIASDADAFAARCIEVYSDPARWMSLRQAALERTREECSPATFRDRVRAAIEGKPGGLRSGDSLRIR